MQDKWNTLSDETKLEIWQKFHEEQPDFMFCDVGVKRAATIEKITTDVSMHPITTYIMLYTLNGECLVRMPEGKTNLNITPLIEWADKNGYFEEAKIFWIGFLKDGRYTRDKECEVPDFVKHTFKITYLNGDLQVEKVK